MNWHLSKPLQFAAVFCLFWVTASIAPSAFAGDAGNESSGGGLLYAFEGFENYAAQSASMRTAITDALELIKSFDLDTTTQFPELAYLATEIRFSKYILIPQDVELQPNRNPGDYSMGGFLVASTDLFRGAPTRIYPKLIKKMSASQLIQMVIHEALHRALPEPMNSYEAVAIRLTTILTQYAPKEINGNLSKYLQVVRTKKLPWIVYVSGNINSETAMVTQQVMRPLYEDNTVLESCLVNTRIEIDVTFLADNVYRVIVADRYRALQYSYDFYGWDPKQPDNIATAAAFVRKSIRKIQDDLSWQ